MAIVVAVSVVMVKQHYIADVVAGFANAGVCYAFAVYALRWHRKRKASRIITQIETELNGEQPKKCNCEC